MNDLPSEDEGLLAGRFAVVRELGRGATGRVVLARGAGGGRPVTRELAPGDARSSARLRAEKDVLAALPEGVAPVLIDAGTLDDGRGYVATEYVAGETLEARMRSGPLDVAEALDVATGIARALAIAHEANVIHRDLKPANVLIPTVEGGPDFASPKLLDFGIAGGVDRSSRLTDAGQVFGTPLYMAPEQLSGRSQSPATDVYGLGALLYEMLYRRPPYKADNIGALLVEILNEPLRFPERPDIPEALAELVASCLAKNMERRPADGSAALAALVPLQRGITRTGPAPRRTGAPGSPPTAEARLPRRFRGAPPGSNLASSPTVEGRVPADEDLPPASGRPTEMTGLGAASSAPSEPRELLPLTAPESLAMESTGAGVGEGACHEGAPPSAADAPVGAPEPSKARSAGRIALWIGGILALVAAGVVSVQLLAAVSWARWVAVGIATILLGVALTIFLRRWLKRRQSQIAQKATNLLFDARARDSLSETLALEVNRLLEKCEEDDERILWHTIALMIGEYEKAKASDDRQKALMNLVELVDKLQKRLSPWYVRYEKLVAFGVGAVTIISGISTTIIGILKLMH